MAETITLYTIPGDECIGDSLLKINANAVTITNSVNELYSLYDAVNIGIPAAKTLEMYEANFIQLSSLYGHIYDNQVAFVEAFESGVLAADFLQQPYSSALSSVAINLSSFALETQPGLGLANQILRFNPSTGKWQPTAAEDYLPQFYSPAGLLKLQTWNTNTDTLAKSTSTSYVSLPGGMIMQFGRLSAIAGREAVSNSGSREFYVQFPKPFPNDVLNITTNTVVSGINGGVSAQSYIKYGFDKKGFTIVKNLSGMGNVYEMWSAIGW